MEPERRPRSRAPLLVLVTAVVPACALSDRDPEGTVCTFGGGVTVSIDDTQPFPQPGGLELAAAATVLDDPTLTLRFDGGAVHRVRYELPGDGAQVFLPGERVWAELWAKGPFWVNYQLELHALDAAGAPGELRLAGWEGEDRMGPVRDWSLAYEDTDCEASDDNGCGPAVARSLRVTAPQGGQALVAPGTWVDLEGYRVSNGRSLRYVSGPTCTDTPNTWSGGSLVRL